jgi:BlaI family penicillinase repressor
MEKLVIPKISDSEWQIMKLLWQKAPQKSSEIIERLQGKVDWNAKTIKTLLNRLVNKKAINYEKEGRAYLYFPIVKKEECQKAERHTFLHKVYNGAFKPMFAAFLEEENLSDEEIEELKKLLEKKGK